MKETVSNVSEDELRAHAGWVRSLARSLVADQERADDLVQETWLRVLRAPRTPLAEEPGRSWLATVLRNVWRERGRSERARGLREETVAREAPRTAEDDAPERRELARALASAVGGLEEPFRSALVGRYYEGLSAAELARRSGEPAPRVRQRLARARQILRERVERERGARWRAELLAFAPPLERTVRLAPAAGGGVLAVLTSAKLGVVVCLGLVLAAGYALLPDDAAVHTASKPEPLARAGAAEVVEIAPALELAEVGVVRASRIEASVDVATSPAAVDAPFVGGTVVASESGLALEGVEVTLFSSLIVPSGRHVTRTDAAGTFRFEGLDEDDYTLSVRAAERVPWLSGEGRIRPGANEHRIELLPGFVQEVDVVAAHTALPVEGARVLFISGDRRSISVSTTEGTQFRSVAAVSDATGRARLPGVERGLYQVVVSAVGFASALLETAPRPGGEALRIELAPEGSLEGRVVLADGTPAVGARVFLNPVRLVHRLAPFYFPENGVETDATGHYRLRGLSAADYWAVVLCPDGSGAFHTDGEELVAVSIAAGVAARLDVRLPAPGRVVGTVVTSDGTAVPDVRVSVSWGDFKQPHTGFFELSRVKGMKDAIHHATRTDAAGRFVLAGLRTSYEPLSVSFRKQGYVTAELELVPPAGATREVTVELAARLATVGGRLLDADGEPVAGLTVGAWDMSGGERGDLFLGTADAAGRYVVSVPVTATLLEVFPILRAGDPWTARPERLDALPEEQGLDFSLFARAHLSGRVVDTAGVPVRAFEVHLFDAETGRFDEVNDADRGEGRFGFPVDSESRLEAVVSAPGFVPARLTDLADGRAREVVLMRGADLVGRVVDAAGRGLEGALVCLATLDGALLPPKSELAPHARTDATGRFVLSGVPVGPQSRLLVAPGRANAPPLVQVALAELGDELVVRIPVTSSVTIEITDAGGAPAAGLVVLVDADGWPLDPRIEATLVSYDEVRNSDLGVLTEGRTHWQLAPGAYAAVWVRPNQTERAFEFTVADDGLPQTLRFAD